MTTAPTFPAGQSREKTVLLTNFHADMGGGEFALLEHARWLVNAGTHVSVLLFHDGELERYLRAAGCSVRIIRQRLDYGPRGAYLAAFMLVPKIVRLLRCIRPAYVMTYTRHELPFTAAAGRLCGVPVVYREQCSPPNEGQDKDWREHWLLKRAPKVLAGILCTTRMQEAYLQNIGMPQQILRTVYLGADAKRFGADTVNTVAVRKSFGPDSDTCLIGFFGRLIEWKGHEVFLRALSQTEGKWQALIVGGPQLNEAAGEEYVRTLKQYARECGLDKRVVFTGFRDDVPALMTACDVVAHASKREPFGLVLIEAAMCGKPVVASDVSGPREIVVDDETGFLFSPGNPREMSLRLSRLITDKELRARMGQAARSRARAVFDGEKNLSELNRVVDRLLGGRQ